MITKRAKANWHYSCELCGTTSRRSTDLYGAQLAEVDHKRSRGHVQRGLDVTVQNMSGAIHHVANELHIAVEPVFQAFKLALDQSFPEDWWRE